MPNGPTVTTDSRCELTELYRSQCAHCRQLPDIDIAPYLMRQGIGRWVKARFAGRCVECDYQIEPGDQIRLAGDGYLCVDCGRDYDNT